MIVTSPKHKIAVPIETEPTLLIPVLSATTPYEYRPPDKRR
jgi:hypothetical protein